MVFFFFFWSSENFPSGKKESVTLFLMARLGRCGLATVYLDDLMERLLADVLDVTEDLW